MRRRRIKFALLESSHEYAFSHRAAAVAEWATIRSHSILDRPDHHPAHKWPYLGAVGPVSDDSGRRRSKFHHLPRHCDSPCVHLPLHTSRAINIVFPPALMPTVLLLAACMPPVWAALSPGAFWLNSFLRNALFVLKPIFSIANSK